LTFIRNYPEVNLLVKADACHITEGHKMAVSLSISGIFAKEVNMYTNV
jgi:hypothetical protein